MKIPAISLVAAVIFSFACESAFAGITWKTYKNTRLGFELTYPDSFEPVGEIEPREPGHAFVNAADEAEITAYGMIDTWKMGSEYYLEKVIQAKGALSPELAKPHEGLAEVYPADTEISVNSYSIILKGQRGDKTFFEELSFSCADRVINHLTITYPKKLTEKYEPLVKKIEKRFSAGLGAETPICQ